MSFIPICPKPYDDELLYSWLMRLPEINGLSLPFFANAYMKAKYRIHRVRVPYDIKKEFLPLFQHQLLFHGQKEMIMQTTTFPFESMFLTEGEQAKYINYLTRPADKLNAMGRSLFLKIRICPACYQEDVNRYGEGYFHREHQLSGLCMCPQHHVRLLEYNGKFGDACNFNMADYAPHQIGAETSGESLIAYADYVHALNAAELNTHVDIIKQLIFHHLREKGHSSRNNYAELKAEFEAWEHKSLLSTEFVLFMQKRLPSIIGVSPSDLITLLMFLYPDVQKLIAHVEERSEGYSLLEEHVCDACGKTYCASPKAYRDGWGCPECASAI